MGTNTGEGARPADLKLGDSGFDAFAFALKRLALIGAKLVHRTQTGRTVPE